MLIEEKEKKEKKQWVRLQFLNPFTENVDNVLIRDEYLNLLRSKRGDNLIVISFFHTIEKENYIINLHVDSDNSVRHVDRSYFFLKANKKLFPSAKLKPRKKSMRH